MSWGFFFGFKSDQFVHDFASNEMIRSQDQINGEFHNDAFSRRHS